MTRQPRFAREIFSRRQKIYRSSGFADKARASIPVALFSIPRYERARPVHAFTQAGPSF
jgi:hypothetical protein